MTIKFLFSVVLLFVLSVGCKLSCSKYYDFEIPMTMGITEQYQINDTIWVKMDVSQVLYAKEEDEFVDLSEFDLYFDFRMRKLDTAANYRFINDFEIVVDKGIFRTDGQEEQIWTENRDGQKQFRIGFVPKQTGVYIAEFRLPYHYYEDPDEGRAREGLQISDVDCREYISQTTRMPVNAGYENAHLIAKKCLVYSDGTSWCYDSYDELQRRSGFAVRIVR